MAYLCPMELEEHTTDHPGVNIQWLFSLITI
jgi:hypothetical protein